MSIDSQIVGLQGQALAIQEEIRAVEAQIASLIQQIQQNPSMEGQLQIAANELANKRVALLEQLAQVNTKIAQLQNLNSGTSAGAIVRDDQFAKSNNSTETNPSQGVQYLDNGRIVPPPDTNTSSNAQRFVPDLVFDSGTNAPTRPGTQTQAIPAGANQVSTGPVRDDAFRTPVPSGQVGIVAANDDRGGGNVVASINAINFAEKIIAQPNVLDQYASYTYTASLYLMTQKNIEKLLNTGSRDLAGAKLLVQSGGINQSNRSNYFDLDYFIDDMEIRSFIAGQGSRAAHNVTEVKMRIIEPNGISFIENLSSACQDFVNAGQANYTYADYDIPVADKKSSDKKLPYTSQPYLLVIRFYGYDDQGNLVRGGKKATTTDPNSFVEKFYPLVIKEVGFRIASKAAEYNIKFAAPQYALNGGQARASLPFNFEFSGGTVNDILAGPALYGVNQTETAAAARTAFAARDPRRLDLTDTQKGAPPKANAVIPNKKTVRQGLMAALNDYQQELKRIGKIEFADEFNIEFTLPAMASASIVLPGVNKSTTSMSTTGTPADQKLPSKQSMDTKTQTKAATAGMQIVQFIDTVLRNSSYISDQQVLVVNNKTGKEKPGPGVNLKNTAWYKINFKAVPKMNEFDTIRNDYAYKFTYTISPYKITQLYSPYFKQPQFNGVHKTYKYWFTGENTSVLNYEETLNNLFFIALTNQSQGTTANVNELIKQQPYTASGQASQGGQGRATEPAANAADQLYSAGEFKECFMTIVGDPAWLQQGEALSLLSAKDPNYYQPFLADGTINFDSQEILFEVAFNTPRDYNTATGLIQPSMAKNNELYPNNPDIPKGTAKISRVFIAKECHSYFKQGKFTQQLKATLRMYPLSDTETTNPAPTKTSTVAAKTQSKAPPAPSKAYQPVPSSIPANPGTLGAAINALDLSYEGATIVNAAGQAPAKASGGILDLFRQRGAKDSNPG